MLPCCTYKAWSYSALYDSKATAPIKLISNKKKLPRYMEHDCEKIEFVCKPCNSWHDNWPLIPGHDRIRSWKEQKWGLADGCWLRLPEPLWLRMPVFPAIQSRSIGEWDQSHGGGESASQINYSFIKQWWVTTYTCKAFVYFVFLAKRAQLWASINRCIVFVEDASVVCLALHRKSYFCKHEAGVWSIGREMFSLIVLIW